MEEIFGPAIANPLLDGYGNLDGTGGAGGGLIGFISNLIKVITIVAGIWSLFNLIIAGFTYVTAGENPEATKMAWQKIYMSLIGLAIITASFVMIAIISYVLFGNPGFILNPNITGPGVPTT